MAIPTQSTPLFTQRHFRVLLILFCLLSAFYLSTYSARIQSGDTLTFFDIISSRVRFGDVLLDESLYHDLPLNITENSRNLLKATRETDFLQFTLAEPLYRLASAVPSFGYVHTVWLYNALIAALSGCLLFLLVRAFNYRETTALLMVFFFATATIIWPYSKTFFREPTVTGFLLLATLAITQWRHSGYRAIVWGAVAVLSTAGAFFTKDTAILAFPALALFAFPTLSITRNTVFKRLSSWALIALIILPIFIILSGIQLDLIVGFSPTTRDPNNIEQSLSFTQQALHSYLLSPGGSIWGTSPILLLAVPGLWLLWQRGQKRLVWFIFVAVLGYAVGYATLSGVHWFGGLSWPPRFLVPIVPIALLGALPIIDRLAQRRIAKWGSMIIIGLWIYSLWVQWNGVALDWSQYPRHLPPEAEKLSEWGPGLNTLTYLRWVLLPPLWGDLGFDIAWIRAGIPHIIIALIALMVSSSYLLYRTVKHQTLKRAELLLTGALPFILSGIVALGLTQLYARDGLYYGDKVSLQQIASYLSQTEQGDIVVLSDPTYLNFVLNTSPGEARYITLPFQPGEQPSEQQPPNVITDNLIAQLSQDTIPLLHWLADQQEQLYLLTNTSRYLPWARRPVERFLATHYYPIEELAIPTPDPTARLVRFDTTDAPDSSAFNTYPQVFTDIRFGEHLSLWGYTLPLGESYRPNERIPVTLFWQTDQLLEQNYSVGLLLRQREPDWPIAQQANDPEPLWGFAPTSAWQPHIPVYDNRAIQLPPEVPAGEYVLWVLVYPVGQPDALLPVVAEQTALDGKVAVLPVVITVTE